MENPITRAEHEEFRRRLEEENKRQDTRIGILEDSVRQIGALATARSWATLPRRLWALCLATCLSGSVCEGARECEE